MFVLAPIHVICMIETRMTLHMKDLIEVYLLKQTENSNFIPKNIYGGASTYFVPILAIFHSYLIVGTYMTPHMKAIMRVDLIMQTKLSNFIFKNNYEGACTYFDPISSIFLSLLVVEQ